MMLGCSFPRTTGTAQGTVCSPQTLLNYWIHHWRHCTMSRALIASTGSRRLSREGSTNSPHIQSARLDEQPPPENDSLRPADNEEICRPSVLKPSLGILNTGLPKPSNPQEQKSTSNILPDDSLAAEAQTVVVQEDQPNLSEL
ncbi:hypothetical protein P692DRAFT_20258617 [Suillus brevipes Sb2]|nr:hypothetical protein P692DRAFT_20258617 [Suillus brevipes Sb2]